MKLPNSATSIGFHSTEQISFPNTIVHCLLQKYESTEILDGYYWCYYLHAQETQNAVWKINWGTSFHLETFIKVWSTGSSDGHIPLLFFSSPIKAIWLPLEISYIL